MNIVSKDKSINYLGEFSDVNLEKEFFKQDMQKSIRFIKPIVLILGILNTLFLIPDYFFIKKSSFILAASVRIAFILLIIALFIHINYMKDFKMLAYWVTGYEIVGVLLFLCVFYQYQNPNFLIQAFGVIVILLAVFMVPNRWINMIGVSIFISIGFIVMSLIYVKNLKTSEFSAGIVYMGIVIVLCSIFAFRNHYYKRIQYISDKELTRLAMTDYLTGIFNRVKLDEELRYWISYSKRYGAPLSLTIIDIDNFKRINDTYGHFNGDNVIIEFVRLVNSSIRQTDVFARWGGEEFVILQPNTDLGHSLELAERLRRRIEVFYFEKVGQVTCSFGVVQFSSEDDIESLFCKADKMLYAAKSSGKNVVKS